MNKQTTTKLRYLIVFLLYASTICFLFPTLSDQRLLIQESWRQNRVTLSAAPSKTAGQPRATTHFHPQQLTRHDQVPKTALARLMSPAIGLNETLYAGSQPTTLARGGGWLFPKRKLAKDNIVLIGHHVSNPAVLFGPLVNSQKGQLIYVQTVKELVAYQVTSIQKVPETAVDVLRNTQTPMLTLITCDQAKPTDKRIVIRAKLHSKEHGEAAQKAAQQIHVKSETVKRRKITGQGLIVLVLLVLFLGVVTYVVLRKERKK